jgi:hypothetical protein
LIEGQFYDQVIEPRNIWRQIGMDGLIVSSVDQNRSDQGPSSGPIAHGCTIGVSDIKLQLGQASIVPCSGPYELGGHFKWVGVVTPVIWSAPSSETHPCWERYGITSDAGYQARMSDAVTDSLQDLFTRLQDDQFKEVDAIIIPAIATGVGGLSKASFYQILLTNIVVEELKRDHRLPQSIVLQVSGSETPNRWPETIMAISTSVARSANIWQYQTEHKSGDSEWLSLLGVAIGGLLALILSAFTNAVPSVTESVELFTQGNVILRVLLWASVAVGVVSVFKSLISLFPSEMNPYVQIGAGVLAALFCGQLVRASGALEESLKRKKPIADTRIEAKK